MSEEHSPVICPWCGEEMQAYCWGIENEAGFRCDNCGAQAPIITFTNDMYETQEERDAVASALAYKAATRRPPVDENTSDGYHTFKELYHHRAVLFAALIAQMPEKAWKSKVHSDGSVWDGWFIVGIETPDGMATYHYADSYWDMFCCREVGRAPEWDGHTPAQAIERIAKLICRPANPPLTVALLGEMSGEAVVWEWNLKYYTKVWLVWELLSIQRDVLDRAGSLFFAAKPTQDDIDVAKKEAGSDD